MSTIIFNFRNNTSMNSFEKCLKLLRDLADLQNGPPLEQYRKDWLNTMQEVYAILNYFERPFSEDFKDRIHRQAQEIYSGSTHSFVAEQMTAYEDGRKD